MEVQRLANSRSAPEAMFQNEVRRRRTFTLAIEGLLKLFLRLLIILVLRPSVCTISFIFLHNKSIENVEPWKPTPRLDVDGPAWLDDDTVPSRRNYGSDEKLSIASQNLRRHCDGQSSPLQHRAGWRAPLCQLYASKHFYHIMPSS